MFSTKGELKMSNEIANVVENALLPDVVNPYDENKGEMFAGGGFLPRLQLFTSASDVVKAGTFPINHYGLVISKDQIIDMEREVDVAFIAWRPRAIDASDRNNIRASSITSSDLFKEIKHTQDTVPNSGCMYGPEFLVWVPREEKFATVLFGSKTARNEAPKAGALMHKPATFKSRLIDNGENKWQAMVVIACTTPFQFPAKDEVNRVTAEFLAPKEVFGAEKVEAEVTRAR